MIALALIITIIRATAMIASPLCLLLWAWYDLGEEAATPYAYLSLGSLGLYIIFTLLMALLYKKTSNHTWSL